jgi:hypothetical protein
MACASSYWAIPSGQGKPFSSSVGWRAAVALTLLSDVQAPFSMSCRSYFVVKIQRAGDLVYWTYYMVDWTKV